MDKSDACPTEDAISIFLEYLVDPLLPTKSSREVPSRDQQESVAKQVHAVVLLYNYFYRKQYPHLEYLGFESFCKLAVAVRKNLMVHMKLMQRSGKTELDGLEEQLSLLEKMVIDACAICTSLDASSDLPRVQGWPIQKVAVFLVDSKKKNCFLQFSSMIMGVWSLIEKAVDASKCNTEGTQGNHDNKRKRVTKSQMRDELGADDVLFQKIAFSAVEEAIGIKQSDLIIMEDQVVYSLSKEKSAARFYIMQCTSESDDGHIQVPIDDVVRSLQDPLLKKVSSEWTVTSALEYFHVLPYVSFISDWLHRPPSIKQESKSASMELEGNVKTKVKQEPEVQRRSEVIIADNPRSSPKTGLKNNRDDGNRCPIDLLPSAPSGLIDGDANEQCMIQSQNDDICLNVADRVQAQTPKRKIDSCLKGDSNAKENSSKVEVKFNSSLIPHIAEHGDMEADKQTAGHYKTCSDPILNHAVVNIDELQALLAAKEPLLSETALKALLYKRDKLILQHRNIEDEIAKCDKSIQTILSGGEENLPLKLESVIEACSNVCRRSVTHEVAIQPSPGNSTCQRLKKKKVSEAALNMQTPCQELDAVCYENDWILPTYRVSSSDGGFKAEVNFKDLDFEHSATGDQRSSPREARESAASCLLEKLRSMAEAHPGR